MNLRRRQTSQQYHSALWESYAHPRPIPKTLATLKKWGGRGHHILDVGCGSGFYAQFFRQQGNLVVGVDITPQGVAATRQRGLEALIANLEAGLPFASQTFDMVTCVEVVEHLLQPERALEEIHRVLRPQGQLIVTTPNYSYWALRLLYLAGMPPVGLGRYYGEDTPPWREPHIRFFNPQSLRNFLSQGGFEPAELRSTFVAFPSGLAPYLPRPLGLPLRVLGKLIGNLEFLGDTWPSLLAAGMLVRAVKR